MFERNKRAGTKRQLFLMDQRVIITKEKDADGLFVFKDSLKVHSLSVAEKEGDSPTRFAVGTGTVGSWDRTTSWRPALWRRSRSGSKH